MSPLPKIACLAAAAFLLPAATLAAEDGVSWTDTPRSFGSQPGWDCAEVERMMPDVRPGPRRDYLSEMFRRDGCRSLLAREEGGTFETAEAIGETCVAMREGLAGTALLSIEKSMAFPAYRRSCLEGATPYQNGEWRPTPDGDEPSVTGQSSHP